MSALNKMPKDLWEYTGTYLELVSLEKLHFTCREAYQIFHQMLEEKAERKAKENGLPEKLIQRFTSKMLLQMPKVALASIEREGSLKLPSLSNYMTFLKSPVLQIEDPLWGTGIALQVQSKNLTSSQETAGNLSGVCVVLKDSEDFWKFLPSRSILGELRYHSLLPYKEAEILSFVPRVLQKQHPFLTLKEYTDRSF